MISNFLYRLSKNKSRVNLYKFIESAINQYPPNNTSAILNIGAGGEISKFILDLGLRFTSLDNDPRKNPDILGSAEFMPKIPDSTIDFIFCLEVLEHIPDTDAAITEFLRILRPGGYIIGSTPFLLGIHDAPQDYYRFTQFGIQNKFRKFQEIELKPRNKYFSSIAALIYRRFALDQPLSISFILTTPVLILACMILEFLDWLRPSNDGTTGYFFVFKSPTKQQEQ